ncbi:MAG TPA: hypothetical protein VMS93_03615 [Candidatus Saccharimonadales bacterium]|nr:hypothetical protein [Candidatus Saccharimonadales bacterium]
MRRCLGWLSLALALGAGTGRAAVTQYWTLETPENFLKCASRGAALGGDARAAVGPAVDSLGGTEPLVWAVAAGPSGEVYAGTGHEGRLLRARRGGGLEPWARLEEPEVLSLLSDGRGGVYAGTGPRGRIYHVDPGGQVRLWCELPAHYVWAMLRDADGAVFAATGAEGKLFRVSPTGHADLWWDSPAGHLVCLAWGPGHRLLAGGEEDGVLYEIRGQGAGRALFDSGEKEVKAVAVTAAGDIYISALKVALAPPLPAAAGAAAPAAPRSEREGRSFLYRLLPNGAGTRVWEGAGLVHALVAQGNSVVAAMGDPAQLWQFSADGAPVRVREFDPGSLLCAAADGPDVLVGTGNPGQVYRVRGARSAGGRLDSPTLDGKRVLRWGQLTFDGRSPADIHFLVRSGNSDPPDRGWSEWLPCPPGSNLPAPEARYLQWRAELRGSAELRRVRVAYREQNLAPEIHSVTVLPREPKALLAPPEGGASISQTLPGGLRVEYSLPRQSSRPATFDVSAWARGIRHIRWEASDPNGDPLRYSLEYRAVGERTWKPLASDLEEALYAWDTTSLPDGEYEVRLTASDSTTNSPAEARCATAVSEPTVVDHTPPRWQNLAAERRGDHFEVRGAAHDDLSALVYLAYAVDGGRWVVVEPVDGVLDSPDESVALSIPPLPPGEHTLVLKAVDLSGNVGSAALVLH